MNSPDDAIHSWREAFAIYLNPRVMTMFFLGFAAGLPFLMVFSTLSYWLIDNNISRTTIGFFAWVGITYSVKVFWAPVVDRLKLPLLGNWLGQRRSWILLGQLGIALGLGGLALSDPSQNLHAVVALALLVAFSSATQDISLDAYRIEAVVPEYQGAMSATYIFGYRVAMLVAGAGSLYIADFYSWQTAYFSMAALMAVGIVTVLGVSEPKQALKAGTDLLEQKTVAFVEQSRHLPPRLHRIVAWFTGAVICPFADFFKRNGTFALVILLFIGLFRLSDITMGIMANPFYSDLGFSKSDVATVVKLFGFFATILGSILGGVLVVRYDVLRPLLLGAVLVALTNLLFAGLAMVGPDLMGLAIVITADNFSGGLSNAAFIAYLSGLTNRAYTATQYALFSSIMTLPGKFISGFSGIVVDNLGYVHFFIYAGAVGIPAIVLVLVLMRKKRQLSNG